MRKETAHKRHPSQHELMLHAEAVLDAPRSEGGLIADHVASCRVCAAEVDAICVSLRILKETPLVQPTLKSETALLMRVRKERRTHERLRKGGRGVVRVVRGMSYAAAVIIIAALAFGAVLGGVPDSGGIIAWQGAPATADAELASAKASIEDTFATVRTLSNAVENTGVAGNNPEHAKQKRTVDALNADLAAAQEALTRNPGNARASAVMNASLEQQAETLRGLYIQGTR